MNGIRGPEDRALRTGLTEQNFAEFAKKVGHLESAISRDDMHLALRIAAEIKRDFHVDLARGHRLEDYLE
jgi:hypothetical protein